MLRLERWLLTLFLAITGVAGAQASCAVHNAPPYVDIAEIDIQGDASAPPLVDADGRIFPGIAGSVEASFTRRFAWLVGPAPGAGGASYVSRDTTAIFDRLVSALVRVKIFEIEHARNSNITNRGPGDSVRIVRCGQAIEIRSTQQFKNLLNSAYQSKWDLSEIY